jgi:hypothetical protein
MFLGMVDGGWWPLWVPNILKIEFKIIYKNK